MKKIIAIVIILVVIAGGGYWLKQQLWPSKALLLENNKCMLDADCKYFLYIDECNTPEHVAKVNKEAEEAGVYIGERWGDPNKKVTCRCEKQTCVME